MEYNKTQHPLFAKWIHQNGKAKNILDLGCGDKWYHPFITADKLISIDIWRKATPDIVMDIGKDPLPFEDDFFDLVIMFDIIEHIPKKKGYFALKEAQRVGKKIYLLTPNIWKSNVEVISDITSFYYGNYYVAHSSFWSPFDFKTEEGWKRINKVFNFSEYYFGEWNK